MKRMTLLTLAVVTAGCSPAHSLGVVAMKITDAEAHVCVGRETARAGTPLGVYRNVCEGPKRVCKLVKVGAGTVTAVLNEHYAVAQFPPAAGVREGDLVEVQR